MDIELEKDDSEYMVCSDVDLSKILSTVEIGAPGEIGGKSSCPVDEPLATSGTGEGVRPSASLSGVGKRLKEDDVEAV